MAVFHENMLIGASGQGASGPAQYQVSRSLRFTSGEFLSRTFGVPTIQDKFTLSFWCKLSAFGVERRLFEASTSYLRFTSGDTLQLTLSGGSLTSSAVFRDPSAWYHIVWVANATSQTVYVNNAQVLSGSVGNSAFNSNALTHYISGNIVFGLSGYLTEINFIDGQTNLTPSSFAETDATTRQWIPKSYGGTYGNNGFKLTFADNSATTSTALGKDSAGSNDWTPNGFSVTAGITNDSLVDTPTSYGTDTGAGGEVRGNYCILNPLAINQAGGSSVISDGGLDGTSSTGNNQGRTVGTMAVSSGAWYWEVTVSAPVGGPQYCVGIAAASEYTEDALGTTSASYAYLSTAQKRNANTSSAYGATYTALDVIGVALDLGTGTLTFYKNGTSQGSAYTGLSGSFVPAFSDNGAAQARFQVNFGQRPFTYAAPSGHRALCDTNMSAPVIADPSAVIDAVMYTGNGTGRTIGTSVATPSLVWIKGRSSAFSHYVYDTVRTATNALSTNTTDAEFVLAGGGGLLSFVGNGFTLGTNAGVNSNGTTYVAWCWNESVSTGLDIVSYTGNGTNRTLAHALGVAPSLIIIKQRTAASTTNWAVWHKGLAATEYLLLNSTATKATGLTYWNSTLPTSSVFSLGTSGDVNTNAGTYIAYLFAPVAGYSAFGSYTGTGLADGTFVHTGFRPRWIMIKQTTTASATDWVIVDALRVGFNADNNPLAANTASAEGVTDLLDITSTGFKVRSTDVSVNASASATYVYVAFAEAPFQYARAR